MTIEVKNDGILGRTNENTLHIELMKLQQENQELKAKLELYENGVYFSSEVDEKDKEIDKLKKQLEEKNKPQIFIDTQDIEERYAEGLYQDYLEEENTKLINQQKEFIKYMNKTIEDCNNYSKYIEKKTKELHGRSYGKTYIANEIMKNEVAKKILKEILSKYKEIIGSKG